MAYWVYILECSDESFYTGRTNDTDRRVSEHQQGLGGTYTASRRPVKLVGSWMFETEEQAYAVERQIKGWSRAKKKALIREDFRALVDLSKGKRSKP